MKQLLFAALVIVGSAQALKATGLRNHYTHHLVKRAAFHQIEINPAGKYQTVHKNLCKVANSGVDLQLAQIDLSSVVGEETAAAYVEATTLAGCES